MNIIRANWTLPGGAKPKGDGYGHSLIFDNVKHYIGDETIYAELSIPVKMP